MQRRSSKSKDPNRRAFQVVEEATRDAEEQTEGKEAEKKPAKNPAAVALGKLGGKKGGKARAEKLSAKRRKEIARKAAEARWRSNDS